MNDVVQEPERSGDGIGLKADEGRNSVPDEGIELDEKWRITHPVQKANVNAAISFP
jgi:hypothetical protein